MFKFLMLYLIINIQTSPLFFSHEWPNFFMNVGCIMSYDICPHILSLPVYHLWFCESCGVQSWRGAGQEISCCLLNLKVQQHIHTGPCSKYGPYSTSLRSNYPLTCDYLTTFPSNYHTSFYVHGTVHLSNTSFIKYQRDATFSVYLVFL